MIHGSRNRKTLFAADQLQQILTRKIELRNTMVQSKYQLANLSDSISKKTRILDSAQAPLVEIAALELAPLPLNKSLIKFAQQAYSLGFNRIKVVPLFLAPGVHVTEDIPVEISLAIKEIKDLITIELSTFLGKYSEMVQLLNDKFSDLSVQTRILIAHGSRLSGVTDYYQNLAKKVNAVTAYWSIAPSLEEQIAIQVDRGAKRIAILPYFLFPGKITQAIATKVTSLQAEYPQVDLILGQPLGATEALAELIAKEI